MAHNLQGNFFPMFRPSILQQHQTPHVMPIPSSIPWTIENMPWAQQKLPNNSSQLMQFEARTNLDDRRNLLHAKRKSDLQATTPPAKQFISEEKISAHFNSLHISNDYAQNNSGSMSLDDFMDATANINCLDYRVTAKELEEKLRNANRITVCEDILKMNEEQKKASLLPEALINRIEKPCTALVLWQPPPILELLHRKDDEELQKSKYNNNNSNRKTSPEVLINDIEFSDAADIDDFVDNNNTCNVDYNDMARMDEDL